MPHRGYARARACSDGHWYRPLHYGSCLLPNSGLALYIEGRSCECSQMRKEQVTDPRGGHPMSTTTQARFRAAIVAIAPAVLLFAFVYHPYIANLTDKATVAAALASDTTRWGLSHLAVGVGSGLAVLAFLAIRGYLREAGEERWSILALPFIVIGSTLFAFLPAMGIAMLAVADEGADVQAVLTALDAWFFPILVAGAFTFALGILGFPVGIVRGGGFGPPPTLGPLGAALLFAA